MKNVAAGGGGTTSALRSSSSRGQRTPHRKAGREEGEGGTHETKKKKKRPLLPPQQPHGTTAAAAANGHHHRANGYNGYNGFGTGSFALMNGKKKKDKKKGKEEEELLRHEKQLQLEQLRKPLFVAYDEEKEEDHDQHTGENGRGWEEEHDRLPLHGVDVNFDFDEEELDLLKDEQTEEVQRPHFYENNRYPRAHEEEYEEVLSPKVEGEEEQEEEKKVRACMKALELSIQESLAAEQVPPALYLPSLECLHLLHHRCTSQKEQLDVLLQERGGKENGKKKLSIVEEGLPNGNNKQLNGSDADPRNRARELLRHLNKESVAIERLERLVQDSSDTERSEEEEQEKEHQLGLLSRLAKDKAELITLLTQTMEQLDAVAPTLSQHEQELERLRRENLLQAQLVQKLKKQLQLQKQMTASSSSSPTKTKTKGRTEEPKMKKDREKGREERRRETKEEQKRIQRIKGEGEENGPQRRKGRSRTICSGSSTNEKKHYENEPKQQTQQNQRTKVKTITKRKAETEATEEEEETKEAPTLGIEEALEQSLILLSHRCTQLEVEKKRLMEKLVAETHRASFIRAQKKDLETFLFGCGVDNEILCSYLQQLGGLYKAEEEEGEEEATEKAEEGNERIEMDDEERMLERRFQQLLRYPFHHA
ncbi:hypothetical protein QOT17_001613 [Balamuthia mandrillaris]